MRRPISLEKYNARPPLSRASCCEQFKVENYVCFGSIAASGRNQSKEFGRPIPLRGSNPRRGIYLFVSSI